MVMLLPLVVAGQERGLQGMWYNMENLFGGGEATEELTKMGWSPKKYSKKLQEMGQIFVTLISWKEPDLIGLCETGGANILKDLINRTCLKEMGYRYSVTQGADVRGIQVALLYNVSVFDKKGEASYRIDMKGTRPTRDILHVWGEVCKGETLDVLLCHFPSRSGGEEETKWRRQQTGKRLREVYDSLKTIRGERIKVLVMGDFNEGKEGSVLQNDVGARPWKKDLAPTDKGSLYVMPYSGGSYKYRGVWSTFDKIMVNGGLLDRRGSVYLKAESVRCTETQMLLTKDKTWGGVRPWRTYYGHRYEGGFSDHLPLVFELRINCSPDEDGERQPRPATSRFPEGL
jgi:endonuclease/exonuclease/phosphatase family metal-dependent hydrolase